MAGMAQLVRVRSVEKQLGVGVFFFLVCLLASRPEAVVLETRRLSPLEWV